MKMKFSYIAVIMCAMIIGRSCMDKEKEYRTKEFPDEPAAIVPLDFSRGVNLNGYFQVSDTESSADIAIIDPDVFDNLKELGCSVVRVPMTLDRFVGAAPGYEFDNLFWTRLDELLDLGKENGITIVIDNQSEGLTETFASDSALGFMEKSWARISDRCKNRTGLAYELKNAPDGDYWRANWDNVQQHLIGVIRENDKTNPIIVCAAAGNSIADLTMYEDDNLIYSMNFYGPFIFTHQGVAEAGLGSTGGEVPFPYNPESPLPEPDGLAAEIEAMYASYSAEGTTDGVEAALYKEINAVKVRKGRMFVGEFGAAAFTGADNTQLCKWYETVRNCLTKNSVAWTVSSYTGEFGLFAENKADPDFDKDLNVPLITALGFPVPPTYDGMHDIMVLFSEDWGEDITENWFQPETEGQMSIVSENAYKGDKCIYWKVGKGRAPGIFITFDGMLNISGNPDDYVLQFAVRHNLKGNRMKVWITDQQDYNGATLNCRKERELAGVFTETSEYEIIKIPFPEFANGWAQTSGGEWLEPGHADNIFDWNKAFRVTLTLDWWNEETEGGLHEMEGAEFWIDEIVFRGKNN